MENLLYMLVRLTMLILGAINIAMLIRVITSWIPGVEGGWLDLVYAITEPIVIPIRALFERFAVFKNSPIDFSFLVAFMLLNIARELLAMLAVRVL